MTESIQYIGELLKKARKDKGLSQRRLASLVKLPQSHISKIESGRVDMRLSSLIELSRILEIEPMLIPRSFLPLVRALLQGDVKEEAQTPAYRLEVEDEIS